jgi:hypothetical protein
MVVMGFFGFVENNGAPFKEVGLEQCKDQRTKKSQRSEIGTALRRIYSLSRLREVDGFNVALVPVFPASFVSKSKNSKPEWDYELGK